jgi:alpha-2-macroglobulin
LASSARRGIPIIGINADTADIDLYRIGDRSLARIIADSEFLDQLWEYRLEEIGDTLGKKIWSGTVELEKSLNRETITNFPIDEILPQRKPGIYVMTGRIAGLPS